MFTEQQKKESPSLHHSIVFLNEETAGAVHNLCFRTRKCHISKSPCKAKAQVAIVAPASKVLMPSLLSVAPQWLTDSRLTLVTTYLFS